MKEKVFKRIATAHIAIWAVALAALLVYCFYLEFIRTEWTLGGIMNLIMVFIIGVYVVPAAFAGTCNAVITFLLLNRIFNFTAPENMPMKRLARLVVIANNAYFYGFLIIYTIDFIFGVFQIKNTALIVVLCVWLLLVAAAIATLIVSKNKYSKESATTEKVLS